MTVFTEGLLAQKIRAVAGFCVTSCLRGIAAMKHRPAPVRVLSWVCQPSAPCWRIDEFLRVVPDGHRQRLPLPDEHHHALRPLYKSAIVAR